MVPLLGYRRHQQSLYSKTAPLDDHDGSLIEIIAHPGNVREEKGSLLVRLDYLNARGGQRLVASALIEVEVPPGAAPQRTGRWSRRPPPQPVLGKARDVDLIQRRDDKIGVRGRQELGVVGSGHT